MQVPPPDRLGVRLVLGCRRGRRAPVLLGNRVATPAGEQLAGSNELIVARKEDARLVEPDRRVGFLAAFDGILPFAGLPAIQPEIRPFLPLGEVACPLVQLLKLLS